MPGESFDAPSRPRESPSLRPGDEDSTNVVVGGTFDVVHDGHRALLERAFELGDVTVGVTSDALANQSRERTVTPFSERRAELLDVLGEFAEAYGRTFHLSRIDDSVGPATEPGFDVIVVSPEAKTHDRVERINEIRRERGVEPLDVDTGAEMCRAEDGGRISSTRVRRGEIDRHGRLVDDEA